MASLTETHHQVRGVTVLFVPPEPMLVDAMGATAGSGHVALRAAAADKELVQRLESTLINWTRQVKDVVSLAETGNSSNSPKLESGGPLDELAFYASRCSDLSGVTKQLAAPPLRAVLSCLEEASSAYLAPFLKLAHSIEDGFNEASDLLKFLSILRPLCEQLEKASPKDIPTLLPDLLNRVRVISSISRFYCTEARITGLLKRISNEVLRCCAKAINVTDVFDGEPAVIMARLAECVACCVSWRTLYDETVSAVLASPGGRAGTPRCVLWSQLDTTSIFAQVEAFMQRCADLTEVAEAQVQFARKSVPGSGSRAPLPALGGLRGVELARSLSTIERTFAEYASQLRVLEASALDVKEGAWSGANATVRAGISDLENMQGGIIREAFVGVQAIAPAVALLEAFSSLAKRPAVQRAVDRKASEVYAMFSTFLADAKVRCCAGRPLICSCECFLPPLSSSQLEFESQANDPPLPLGSPRFAGAALWARGIASRVGADWALLQQAGSFLTPCKAGMDASEAWVRFSIGIEEYERAKFTEWMSTISDLDANRVSERLAVPLWARAGSLDAVEEERAEQAQAAKVAARGGPGAAGVASAVQIKGGGPYLKSNFDKRLLALTAEANVWSTFGSKFLVPHFAAEVALVQGETLRMLRATVLLAAADYNALVSSLDDVEARLFSDTLRRLDRKLLPGLSPGGRDGKCSWAVKGVREHFLRDARRGILEVWTTVQAFKTDRASLLKIEAAMRDTSLVDIEKNYIHDEGVFDDRQSKHRVKARTALAALHNEMATTLAHCYTIFRSDGVSVQKAWARFVRSCDARVEAVLRGTVLAALNEIQRTVCGEGKVGSEAAGTAGGGDGGVIVDVQPVFRLQCVLESHGGVEFRPTLTELSATLRAAGTDLVHAIKAVPRLEEVLPVKVGRSYAATDEAIRATLGKIAASALGGAAAAVLRNAAMQDEEEAAAVVVAPAAGSEAAPAAAPGSSSAVAVPPPSTSVPGTRATTPAATVSTKPSFYDIISGESPVRAALRGIAEGFQEVRSRLEYHRSHDFARFEHLWTNDKATFMRRYARIKVSLEQYEVDINKFVVNESEVRSDIESAQNFGAVQVDHAMLKGSLADHCQQWQRHFTQLINDNARKEMEGIFSRIDEATKALRTPPTALAGLTANIKILKEMRRDKLAIEERFLPLESTYELLAKFDVAVDEAELTRLATLRPTWEAFQAELDAGEEVIKTAKSSMKKETTEAINAFSDEMADLRALASSSADGEEGRGLPYDYEFGLLRAKERLSWWRVKLTALRAREAALKPACDVFELTTQNLSVLEEVEKDVEALEALWGLVEQWGETWSGWKSCAFSRLDVSGMEDATTRFRQRLVKLREFRKYGVFTGLEGTIKEFLEMLPLIQAMGNPALRDRHWASIMREVGFSFDPKSDDFTLEKVFEMGFLRHSDFIADISASANKELAIEASLASISSSWNALDLDIVEYKVTHWKIRSTEDLFQLLEDHAVNVSAMKTSPYYPVFAKELDYWEKALATISEIVELQLNVQRQWMYLGAWIAHVGMHIMSLPDPPPPLPLRVHFYGIRGHP